MAAITSKSQLDELQKTGVTCLLMFWAEWHEPSRAGGNMDEVFEALTQKYASSIIFHRVEAEAVPDVSEALGVTVVPTFVGVRNGKIVGKVEGASPPDLAKLAKKLNEDAPPPPLPTPSSSSLPSSSTSLPSATAPSSSSDSLNTRLKSLINTAPVMLFMKGSPSAPRCGFSRQIVEILQQQGVPFASFDILTDEEVRAGLKTYSDWPTYPQLYAKGNLVGGLDIVKEMIAGGSDLKSELGVTDSLKMPAPGESLEQRLHGLINTAPVMLFIKGTPSAPRCGFSRQIVEILQQQGVPFASFDILTDEEVRAGLKTYSDWPTYPQLYAKGNLVGGLDIVKEMIAGGSDLKSELDIEA